MKPAAFFFDLDGTLVDTEAPWTKAIVAFLFDRGISAAEEEIAPIVCGRSWFDIHAELHRRWPSLPKADPAADAVSLRPYYERVVPDPKSVVIASSVEFLGKVASFAPVAIVSGSPSADVWSIARTCGIADRLALVLGAEDYPRGKPAPDGFLRAASLLEVDASECVVVEDSTAGVKAGRAAGMHVLALGRNTLVPQDLTGAQWLVGDLSEINVDTEFEPSGIRYQVRKVRDLTSSTIQDLAKWKTSKK